MSLSSRPPESIKYPNQPLSEVDFEIRFFGEPVVESRRHEFFEEIREQYPLVYVPPLKEGIHPSLQHYKFEREDRSAGVSIALNSIGYYQREYEGASAFIGEVERILGIANKLFSIRQFTRIGWRYINTIPFTRENSLIPLSRFFKNSPSFFSIASHEFSRIDFKATTKFEEEFVSVRLQSDESPGDGNELLIFDIDVYKDNLAKINFGYNDVSVTTQRLHCIARNFFEESITDNYRSVLKGEAYE